MENTLNREWPYTVAAYYGADVKPPKQPGELAIETRHRTASSAVAEVQAARSRVDIGRVAHNLNDRDAALAEAVG